MGDRKQIIQLIRDGKYFVKFVRKHGHQIDVMNGDLLVRPLRWFARSPLKGIGNPFTGRVDGKGTLYSKLPSEGKFTKVADFDSMQQDLDLPAFCLFNWCTINSNKGQSTFYVPTTMYTQFGEFLVFISQDEFIERIMKLTKDKVPFTLKSIQYNDMEFTKTEKHDIFTGKSFAHIFSDMKDNAHMQEVRLIFHIKYDNFIKLDFVHKAKGIDIKDGCIIKLGKFKEKLTNIEFKMGTSSEINGKK